MQDFFMNFKGLISKVKTYPGWDFVKSKKKYFLFFILGLFGILITLWGGFYFGKSATALTPTPSSTPKTTAEIQGILTQSILLMNQTNYDSAITLLEDSLKRYPKDEDLLLQLGIAYRKNKKHVEAEVVYQRLLQNYPGCIECLNNRAVNLVQGGDVSTAISLLQEVIGENPTYTGAHLNLGIAYEKAGQLKLAVASYQEYLKRIPINDSRPEPAMVRERVRQLQEGL
jgi:tetratricopeptide (TPR) repeat protein